MVFSAPEITTVSKPKRKPASADVSDQKKMRPFIKDKDGIYHIIRASGIGPRPSALSPQPSALIYLQRRKVYLTPEGRRPPPALSLSPADSPSRASREFRRPLKSRWCSPSSADCPPPTPTGIHRRNTGSSPRQARARAPRCRVR